MADFKLAFRSDIQNAFPNFEGKLTTISAWMQPHSWIEPHPIEKLIEPQSKIILKKIQPQLEYNPTPPSHQLLCFEVMKYSYLIGCFEWAVFGLGNLSEEN